MLIGAVLLAVLPAAFLTTRVAGDAASLSDLVLVAGAAAAAVSVRAWWRPVLARPLLLVAAYQAVLLLAVIWNPGQAPLVDWLHRGAMMGGGLVVGYALAAEDRVERAVQAYVGACLVVAGAAVVAAVTNGFEPVYPLGIGKNLAGGLLAVALVVSLALLREARWNGLACVLLALGVAATQSRAAALAVAVGVGWILLRERRVRAFLVPFLVAGVAGTLLAVSALQSERVDDGLGSVETRVEFRRVAMEYWRDAPLLGQGLRFYADTDHFAFPRAQDDAAPGGGIRHPHNMVVEALSEAGVIGLGALVALLAGALMLVRDRRPLAVAASAACVVTVTLGLFDLYWLAGRTTVPWVLLGLAFAAAWARRPQTLDA
jgi:O-antigen ligase